MTIPPPLPAVAELLEIVDVLMFAEPEPMPPGAANAKIIMSNPPPPIPPAVLRLIVLPVTVRVPVPPVWAGDDGVYATPPPLLVAKFAMSTLVRSAPDLHDVSVATHGASVPPISELVIVRLPPVIWMPPPPSDPTGTSWLFETLTALRVSALLSSPPMIPPPPMLFAVERPPVIVSPEKL